MSVAEQRTLPAQFVEDLGVDLAKQITAQTAVPIVTGGIGSISQQPGETAEGFKARQDAARAFTTREQSLAGLAPQIAGQDQLQKDAQARAIAGLGSFQPFLTEAQASTGPQAFQQFMSSYQQQVIDTSLSEFDRQAAINRQRTRDQAVASGAFGGGREGVQLAEYDASSDRNRALLQANLLQQGLGQAQAQAQQNFKNQMGLAAALPSLQGTDIQRLGSLGALNQAQAQAQLDAQREATRMAAFQPQEQLDRFAGQVTGLIGGYPAQFQQTVTPNPTPLQTALGVGSTLAGIYGAVNPRPIQFSAEGGRIGYAEGSDNKGIMQVAEIDMLKEEYDKYVYDLLEQRPDAMPMSFEEFRRMVMSGQG